MWTETDKYWISSATNVNSTRLLTSDFGAVLGVNPYMTALDVLTRILSHGSYSNCFDPITKATRTKIYKWYYDTYDVRIHDIGTAIPKWNSHIEATIDGIVENGIVSMYTPNTMYRSLAYHATKIENGWIPDKYYHDHIFEDHYVQMQANMKICDRTWCDYLVFVPRDNQIYIERIYYNDAYWNSVWPLIDNYLSNTLIPTLTTL